MTTPLKVREILIKMKSVATRLESFIEDLFFPIKIYDDHYFSLALGEIERLRNLLEELERSLKEAESDSEP